MSEEYPNAPPWIEIMLEENSLIKAMRLERERAQLERIIQRTKFDFSDETAIPLPATRPSGRMIDELGNANPQLGVLPFS